MMKDLQCSPMHRRH